MLAVFGGMTNVFSTGLHWKNGQACCAFMTASGSCSPLNEVGESGERGCIRYGAYCGGLSMSSRDLTYVGLSFAKIEIWFGVCTIPLPDAASWSLNSCIKPGGLIRSSILDMS